MSITVLCQIPRKQMGKQNHKKKANIGNLFRRNYEVEEGDKRYNTVELIITEKSWPHPSLTGDVFLLTSLISVCIMYQPS